MLSYTGICTFITVSALILAALAAPPASATGAELQISEPKYGTNPAYVNSLTLFTLSGGTDMWYRWGGYDYIPYTEPFHAEGIIGSGGAAPGLPVPLDGLQTLYYYDASDESPKSFQVFVDDYYPMTAASIIGANITLNSRLHITPDAGIRLTATDPGSGVAGTYFKVDDDPYTQYLSPFKVTGTGEKTLFYYSTDNLGNREPDKELALYVDGEPPYVSIVPGSPSRLISDSLFLTAETQISVSANDVSSISSTSYRIDGGSWVTYSGPFTLSGEGQRTIVARATDGLGQQSPETTLVVRLDNTPPVVSAVGHSLSSIRVRPGDSIELDCSDTGVGNCVIRYSTDDGMNWVVYTSPVIVLGSTELLYYAEDALGNSAETRSLQISVAEPRPWNFYVGIALIIGAVCLLVYTFIPTGRKPGKAQEKPSKRVGK